MKLCRHCGAGQPRFASRLCTTCGKPTMKSSSAHTQFARDHGSAKTYLCVSECGGMAFDWSYNGGDPNELLDHEGKPYSMAADGSGLNPEFYSPRCRSCHAHLDDKGHRAKNMKRLHEQGRAGLGART